MKSQILNEVGRWRAITLKGLSHCLQWKGGRSTLARRVQNLEVLGLLHGVFEKRHGKYLTLTKEGAELSVYDYPYSDSQAGLHHDLVCSNTIQKLVEFRLFHAATAIDHIKSDINPDGIIHATRYGDEYTLAIEVELHQKSKKRIRQKFERYQREWEFDHVLYITHKNAIFDAYRKILDKIEETAQEKIILSLDPTLSISKCDYQNAIYWMDGSVESFEKIFGEEK